MLFDKFKRGYFMNDKIFGFVKSIKIIKIMEYKRGCVK